MTLSNTYLSRKQLLADNLNSMGVLTVDADDGLTTLINAVLDIEPSIGGLDLDTAVSITASESTIIVGQSVVLTSKLTASYDDDTIVDVDLTGVLTGATIHFKEGNTVIGTGITDNSGVATAAISNLTSGTHTIKAVFEGTENFNDCQSSNITITVNNPAPASITVSSDKPIMLKGETATITATVLDANGNPCVGETVSFEVVNGESLGSDVTDSSGEASVYYLGKGTGDLNIRANCGIIQSEIFVRDALLYREGYTKSESGVNVNFPSAYKIMFKTFKSANSNSVGTINIFNDSNQGIGLGYFGSSTAPAEIRYYNGSTWTGENSIVTPPLNQDIEWEYTYENGVGTVKIGQSSKSYSTSYTATKITWGINSQTNLKIKDLLIMPL